MGNEQKRKSSLPPYQPEEADEAFVMKGSPQSSDSLISVMERRVMEYCLHGAMHLDASSDMGEHPKERDKEVETEQEKKKNK